MKNKKKIKLKEPFKIPIKEKRKHQKIKIFEKYVIHKKKQLDENKYLTFN